jgi:prolycopene isomerase
VSARPDAVDVDVAVVGSGLAALATGALIAQQGVRVALFEQGDSAGGYAHSFKRGDYHFDPAVHLLGDPPLFDGVLSLLGVADQVETLAVDRFYRLRVEDLEFDAPVGRGPFVEALSEAFPHEREGIRSFMQLCGTVHAQAHDLPPQLGLDKLDEAAERFPELFHWRKRTIKEALDEHVHDPRLRAAISTTWNYLGVPPSQASFLTFAQLTCVHLDGVFAYRGGTQALVDALVAAIHMHGGSLQLKAPVGKILVEEGRAIGIELEDGTVVRAGLVISNADPFQTFEQLVGEEHVPAPFLRKLRKLRPSSSAFCLFAATTCDLTQYDPPHQIFSFSSMDYDRVQAETKVGKLGTRCITPSSVLDPGVAPPGEHVVSANANAPFDVGRSWRELKQECQDALVDVVDEALPGFKEGLTYVESATPLTMQAYSRNVGGAIHSFEQTPDQIETKRPPQVTPVPGLIMSSQWTSTGGSALRSFVAGIAAAKIVLHQLGRPDELPDFRSVPNLVAVP